MNNNNNNSNNKTISYYIQRMTEIHIPQINKLKHYPEATLCESNMINVQSRGMLQVESCASL